MNVTINKIDAVNATITVSLEEKDYQDKVKKALRDINMTRPEPGFRPGKVPAGLIQKKYGKAVKYIAAFGPVFPTQENVIHQKDEFISIENLMKNIEIMAHAMYRLSTC